MADRTNRQKLIHLHTGENRAPSASVLNYGEIAVMHNDQDPALYIKTAEDKVAKFIDRDAIASLIDTKISGATQDDFLALKSYVDGLDEANDTALGELSGSVETLEGVALTGAVVNNVTGTVANNVVTVEIDAEDIAVGKAVTYSGASFIAADDNTADALQALSDKIKTIDGVVSESNHGHDNKAVLDGIDATDVENWDNAFASAHTHENKALLDTYTQTEADLADAVSKKHEHANASVLDGISVEDVEAWDDAAGAIDGKVDKVEGKGLSTEDYTTAEKEKLATIAASAQTNVIESVKVNGTALTVTDKAVDILVAEGTANGTVKVNGVDVPVHGLGSAAYQDATAFDASGAAATAKSEVIGDASDSGDTLGKLEDRLEGLETGSSVSISTATTTEGYLKSYTFSQNGNQIGVIDIPKDLVVTSGQVTLDDQDRKVLRLTIANQAEPVDILVSDLVDVYTEGNGIEVSTGNVISAKVVAGNGLSLDSNGIAMAAASSNGAGAMSAAHYDKLEGIESGAEVNVLEGVQVNGADLTPDANKKVNVTITAGTNNGTIAVNGSDVAVTGLGSAAFENTSAFDASGAAEAASAAAITAVVGDMTGETKTLGALQDAIEAIDAGDHNVIEGVEVNGSALSPDTAKTVSITITGGTANGTIAVNGTDIAVTGLGSAAFANTTDFDAAGDAEAARVAAVSSAVTAVVGDASASGSTLGALEDRMDGMDLGDHNVIEEVQVNGTALSVSNKAVNVTVAEGATDGTIAVNGTDVAVHGLGSAAYAETTDFDTAGAAAAASAAAVTTVVGTTGDTSADTTVYGAKAYADEKAAEASAAAANAVQGVSSATSAATAGVVVDGDKNLDFTLLSIDCGEY